MNGLPADLAEPLHILEPSSSGLSPVHLLWLLLAFLLWRFLRRRGARQPATGTPTTTPAPPPAPDLNELERAMRDIRLRSTKTGDYRRGCHELSAYLREYHEKRRGRPATRLTARELVDLGEAAVGNFFSLLGDLQFGRRLPTHEDLRTAIDLARDVFLKRGSR